MKAIGTVTLIGLLSPFGMGMFGIGMHFIPVPSFKWGALVLAVAYCAILAAVALRLRRPRSLEEKYDELGPLKWAGGIVVAFYFSYVGFRMTVPALITEVIGTSANNEFVIESLKKSSPKAWLCPYRLSLAKVTTVLDDSFCVSEEFARQHSEGQSIRLTGKQSRFGFRFLDAS